MQTYQLMYKMVLQVQQRLSCFLFRNNANAYGAQAQKVFTRVVVLSTCLWPMEQFVVWEW